jgi:hypothetical protein
LFAVLSSVMVLVLVVGPSAAITVTMLQSFLALHPHASTRQPDGMLSQLRLSPSVYFRLEVLYFEQSASVVQSGVPL